MISKKAKTDDSVPVVIELSDKLIIQSVVNPQEAQTQEVQS